MTDTTAKNLIDDAVGSLKRAAGVHLNEHRLEASETCFTNAGTLGRYVAEHEAQATEIERLKFEVDQLEADAIPMPPGDLEANLKELLLDQKQAIAHCDEEIGEHGLCECMHRLADTLLRLRDEWTAAQRTTIVQFIRDGASPYTGYESHIRDIIDSIADQIECDEHMFQAKAPPA